MKTKLPNYVFYFPYRGVGGVPVLFLRIAEYVTSTYQIPCYVVDYCDGFMAKNKKNPQIELIAIEDNDSFVIPENSIIIHQSDLPWGIPRNIQTGKNTRIFFWNCYPFNLIPTFPSPVKELMSRNLFITKLVLNTLLLPSKIKIRKFLKYIVSEKAISFMDGPNLHITEYCLGVKLQAPQFLPIFIKKTDLIAEKTLHSPIEEKPLCFCWVGRIADFKIHILNKVLQDCFEVSREKNTKVEFLIIGSGDQSGNLFNNFENNENFKINLIPYLAEKDLNQILIEKVDCLFAMGTSALEGAKLGIPTVLLDFSYSEVPKGYKYNFLFEAEDFSLGDMISSENLSKGHDIQVIVESVKTKKEELALKCNQYFLEKHSLENNIASFFEQSINSTLSYQDLINNTDMKKPFFYRAWALIKKIRSLNK